LAITESRRIASGWLGNDSFHVRERLGFETQNQEIPMKTKKIISFALVALLGIAGTAIADTKTQQPSREAATLKQIEGTFGFVPAFVKSIPSNLLPAFWDGIVSFQMNPGTKLDGKTKELIGLAVAAAIPCEYCIYFHTEAAKLNGATDQEIQEAVGMSALTRQGSTLLNGLQVDKAQFKKDIERIVRGAKASAKK
jgi:AhpD family alkylhydroperoxidase